MDRFCNKKLVVRCSIFSFMIAVLICYTIFVNEQNILERNAYVYSLLTKDPSIGDELTYFIPSREAYRSINDTLLQSDSYESSDQNCGVSISGKVCLPINIQEYILITFIIVIFYL